MEGSEITFSPALEDIPARPSPCIRPYPIHCHKLPSLRRAVTVTLLPSSSLEMCLPFSSPGSHKATEVTRPCLKTNGPSPRRAHSPSFRCASAFIVDQFPSMPRSSGIRSCLARTVPRPGQQSADPVCSGHGRRHRFEQFLMLSCPPEVPAIRTPLTDNRSIVCDLSAWILSGSGFPRSFLRWSGESM